MFTLDRTESSGYGPNHSKFEFPFGNHPVSPDIILKAPLQLTNFSYKGHCPWYIQRFNVHLATVNLFTTYGRLPCLYSDGKQKNYWTLWNLWLLFLSIYLTDGTLFHSAERPRVWARGEACACSGGGEPDQVSSGGWCLSVSRFINARRRIVQPLIDQSNRAGASGKFVLVESSGF